MSRKRSASLSTGSSDRSTTRVAACFRRAAATIAAAGIGAGLLQRHAVVGLAAQLLGAAQEQRGHDAIVLSGCGNRGPHHRRVVLAVHEDERALHHERPAAVS